jgi:hypothetical protein
MGHPPRPSQLGHDQVLHDKCQYEKATDVPDGGRQDPTQSPPAPPREESIGAYAVGLRFKIRYQFGVGRSD